MNLCTLPDRKLLEYELQARAKEKQAISVMLSHLAENERRRLFSDDGYQNLYDYCIRKLGYSKSEAALRISAMRMLKAVPEAKHKLDAGTITLTSLSRAQTFARQEGMKTKAEKQRLIKKLENKTCDETKRLLLKQSTAPEKYIEKSRPVTQSHNELRLLVDNETLELLNQARGALAHKLPRATNGDLVKEALQVFLRAEKLAKPKRYSKSVRLKVKENCVNCDSTYALELDHIRSKAKGGSNKPQNMRTFCRNCNQRAAIKTFGAKKMQRHLSPNKPKKSKKPDNPNEPNKTR